MNLRGKIVASFVLVSIVVGLAVFFYDEQRNEIEANAHVINTILLLHENQESDFLFYLQGNQEFTSKITDRHNQIQQNLKTMITKASDEDKKILQNLQHIDSIIYKNMLDADEEGSTASLMKTQNEAFEDFLMRNNFHITRISEYKNYWEDTTPIGLLDNILYNIDKERTLLLNFEPSNNNWSEIRDEFRNTNDFVVSNLVSLLIDEIDFHISIIKTDDPKLQEIKNSLISQKEIAMQISATSFPSITSKQSELSKMPVLDMVTGDELINTTVMFGEKCEENIVELENSDYSVRQRHNIKEVGENKNTIQVLISVIKCQQELRINAEDYMGAKLAIQKHLNIFYPNLDLQFHQYSEQLSFAHEKGDEAFPIFVILFIPLIGGIVTFGIFISDSMTKPLRALQKTMTKVAKGDYDVIVSAKGTDEIAQLSESFNTMTKELVRQQDSLIKSERMSAIGQIASRIAHDLKNPLSALKGSIALYQLKKKGQLDEKDLTLLGRMNRSILRIDRQINDVLDFVREKPLTLSENKLSKILAEAIDSIQKPDRVMINLPQNDFTIKCDTTKMESIFINLLTNAIQSIGHEGKITINFSEDKDTWVLEFIDSGPGISEDVLPKIFEPLVTTKQTGTGLGLVTCKKIVEQHGGSISVKNNPTTFTIRLPKK